VTTYLLHPPEEPHPTQASDPRQQSPDAQQLPAAREGKNAEESEERFRILFESAPDAYYLSDLLGTFLDGNRAAEELVGYAREELIGKNFLEIGILPVEQVPAAAELLLKNMEGLPTGPDEFTLNRKDGSQVSVEIRTFPVQLDGQSVVLGIARDISLRKEAEAQLRYHAAQQQRYAAELAQRVAERTAELSAMEARFRELVESSPDALVLTDAAGAITLVNQQTERLFGYQREELLGRTVEVLLPEQMRAAHIAHRAGYLAQPYRRPMGASLDLHGLRKDGSQFPVGISLSPVKPNGETWVISSIRDISDQRQVEAQLHLSADRLALLHNIDQAILAGQTPAAIASVTLQRLRQLVPCQRTGVVLLDFVNREATLLATDASGETQLTPGLRGPLEALKLDTVDIEGFRQGRQYEFADLLTITDPPLAVRALQAEGVRAYLVTPLIAEGELIGVLNLGKNEPTSFTPAQKEIVQEVASQLAIALQRSRDITARQQAENTFHTEATITAALARVGREMISSLDTSIIVQHLCTLVVEVLGCHCCHVALLDAKSGAFVNTAGAGYTPEQWELLRMARVPQATLAALETQPPDAEEAYVIKRTVPAQSLLDAMLQQTELHTALLVPLRRSTRLIGVLSAAYRDDREFTDTQQRLAKGIAQLASLALTNANLVEELQDANRLKDDFVGAMSHELRTPLNVILGYIELLLDETYGAMSEEQNTTLQRVDQHARELVDLVNNLLDINRLRTRKIPLRLREITLDELLAQLQAEIPAGYRKPTVALQWRHEPVSFPLYTDPVKLKIVLKNLITNALKFTDTGSITVVAHPEATGVAFSVSDTGIGIPPEHLPHIFEAFRQVDNSSTRTYGGVGLGLYITQQLLELLGGTISVDSTPGKGTTFRVWVPARLEPQGGD
jgi:PAS domain S-box-containing protein